ncbi:MAG TPA: hypothetical protein VGI48_13230 [Caldimonas sp.]
MTIRTASLSRQIRKNGDRLHRAVLIRIDSRGADQPPSEAEVVLLEERRQLKEARAARAAQAQLPRARPKPAWMLKPPRPPKPPKAHKEKVAKDAKSSGVKKPSRADKQVRKAESLEAAKKAAKKSAKN